MAENENLRVDIGRTDPTRLSLEPHRITAPNGFQRISQPTPRFLTAQLRLYPPVPAILRASVGTVRRIGTYQESIIGEAVTFRGTREASTRHLVSSGLTVDVSGTAFDAEGNPLSVSISADDAGGLVASAPFYGAAIVSYNTQYTLLEYSYGVTTTAQGAFGGGTTTITAGTVLAFYQGKVATLDAPAPEMPSGSEEPAELYRDVSYTILQEDEEFERPPNWPDSGDYAIAGLQGPDPDEGWIEHERVHEIGWIDKHCRLFTDRPDPTIKPAKPFQGDSNYEIPIERIEADDQKLSDLGLSTSCIAAARQKDQELG